MKSKKRWFWRRPVDGSDHHFTHKCLKLIFSMDFCDEKCEKGSNVRIKMHLTTSRPLQLFNSMRFSHRTETKLTFGTFERLSFANDIRIYVTLRKRMRASAIRAIVKLIAIACDILQENSVLVCRPFLKVKNSYLVQFVC